MTEGLAPDPAVLGRILLLHSGLHAAPDTKRLMEMVAHELATFPGVAACSAYVDGRTIRVERPSVQGEYAAHVTAVHGFQPASSGFGHGLGVELDDWLTLELRTARGYYGALYLHVYDEEAVAPYIAFAGNTANLVALHIENARTAIEYNELNSDLDRQVKERTHQLRESQKRLSEAQRIARIGSFESDRDGDIVWWSDHLYHLFGLNPTTFTPTRESFLALVHPDDVEKLIESINRCLETGEVVQSEFFARFSDGTWRQFETFASPIRDRYGRVSGLRGSTQDITKRRETEASLRESNLRFSQISEHIDDIFWLFDVEDPKNPKVLYLSQAYERVFQRPVEDVYRDSSIWYEYVHPDDRERVTTAFQNFLKGKDKLDHELRSIRPNNSVRTVVTRGTLIRDKSGKVIRAAGITRDVTERKLQEALIKGQNLVLKQMVAGASLESVLNTLVLTMEEQTDGTQGAVHILRDEDGLRLFSGAAPSLPKAYTDALEGARIGPNVGSCGTAAYRNTRVIVEDIETDPLWKDFRDLAVGHGLRSCWSQPVRNSMGDVLGTFALYYHQPKRPTDRELELIDSFAHLAAVAIERVQAEEALRKGEKENRAIVENAPYCIHQIDRQGRIISINSAGVRMMGASCEKALLGTSYVLAVAEEDRARVETYLNDALDGRSSEFEFTAVNGLAFASSFVPILDDVGDTIRIMGITQDVTERKRAEKKRLELEAQLRQSQKMEAVGQLAGGVAHDFNNLLTAILGNAEVLLEVLGASPKNELTERLQSGIGEIQSAGTHAASLTRQLLAFSRRDVLRPELVDPLAVVNEMETLLRRLIGEHIELEVELDPETSLIHADSGQVEQVIMNLVVNAVDSMPDGGRLKIGLCNVDIAETPMQEVEDVRPGRYVQLSVCDSGTGMSPETLEHIFEPFFTTKPIGKGTGLGLSTVYGILKQSGGFVNVESTIGTGTTFKARFPAIDRTDLSSPLENPPAAEVVDASILVCEDEDMVRSVMCRALMAAGYSVIETENGEKALEAARIHDGPIDLLISDVVMPGMSGIELAEKLVESHPNARVLFVSGYSADHLDAHGVESGTTQLLQKPFGPSALVQRVQEML